MQLSKFLEGENISLDNGLFLVYGKAGVGKTTFLMELARSCGGKIFVLDVEHGFSIERFEQVAGDGVNLNNILVSKPNNFEEQAKIISSIVNSPQIFSFVGIDTIGKYYRAVVKKNPKTANNELARQMRVLKEISRNKPVVVCNQVYHDLRKDRIEPLGRDYVKKWCDYIIELGEVDGKRKLKIMGSKTSEKDFVLSDKGFNFS
tara:strand:- start:2194 stop:2805 length:612 start_codon:yes stop_codon:yes gene_type:complete